MHSMEHARAAQIAGTTIAPPQHCTPDGADATPGGSGQLVTNPQSGVGTVAQGRARKGAADTSAEAFHSLSPKDYLSPKEQAVMALFTGPEVRLSRQQIADLAPMRLCGACGRVDSLLAKGELEECGDRIAPDTGKRQKTLRLPRDAQMSLIEGDA